jgi:hypothetical protein
VNVTVDAKVEIEPIKSLSGMLGAGEITGNSAPRA